MISGLLTAIMLLVIGALLFVGGFVYGYVKGVRRKQPNLSDVTRVLSNVLDRGTGGKNRK